MANKYFENIALPIIKYRANLTNQKPVINIIDVIVKARTILTCMPAKLDDFGVARNYLMVLQKNFPGAKFIVIVQDSYKTLIDEKSKFGMIFVTEKDTNILGLPKRQLLQKLSASKYDIAIDLNHSFHLLSTYLCLKSGATLRVCMENKEREPFYNFSFRYPVGEQLENKYRKLFKYLNANVSEAVANT